MNLSPDEFWDLSWFEWSLYLFRYEEQEEREKFKEETEWQRFRIQWAQLNNAHFKEKVKPTDLIKLSFDEEKEKVSTPLTPEEVEAKFGKHGRK